MTAPLILVVAMADDGVIGAGGRIPWRIPGDMRRFKALTIGKPIVAGRKTWDSFPKKPLPGRTNIVITRDRGWSADGAVRAHSLDQAVEIAMQESPPSIGIAGGAEIYQVALPRAARIELTEVHTTISGSALTVMPPIDRHTWRETFREEHATEEGLRYSYVTLERI